MIPLALNPARVRIGLAGAGAPAARRLAALRAGGAAPALFALDEVLAHEPGAQAFPPEGDALERLDVLFLAGLSAAHYAPLAAAARARGVLVNVEDVPALCDVHAVAELRRGELLLTISTGGTAPGLAGLLREALADIFPPDWAQRVAEIAAWRQELRAQGLSMAQIRTRMAEMMRERCWLPGPDLK